MAVEKAWKSFLSARGELSCRIAEFEKVHSDLFRESLALVDVFDRKIAEVVHRVVLKRAKTENSNYGMR